MNVSDVCVEPDNLYILSEAFQIDDLERWGRDREAHDSPGFATRPSALVSLSLVQFMIVYLPLMVAIVGLIVYVLSSNGKAAEIGRIMFWCGLLVTLAHGIKF